MPGLVYLLCAATSLASGFLLLRGAVTRGGGLLFWSSLCFFGMALNNVLMYVDAVVVPGTDLSFWPNAVSLASVTMLSIALIWYST